MTTRKRDRSDMEGADIKPVSKLTPEEEVVSEQLRTRHEIALAVALARHDKGWSQQELAKSAGTKQSRISEIENAKGNPRLSTLEKVTEALGLEIKLVNPNEGVICQIGQNALEVARDVDSHTIGAAIAATGYVVYTRGLALDIDEDLVGSLFDVDTPGSERQEYEWYGAHIRYHEQLTLEKQSILPTRSILARH